MVVAYSVRLKRRRGDRPGSGCEQFFTPCAVKLASWELLLLPGACVVPEAPLVEDPLLAGPPLPLPLEVLPTPPDWPMPPTTPVPHASAPTAHAASDPSSN